MTGIFYNIKLRNIQFVKINQIITKLKKDIFAPNEKLEISFPTEKVNTLLLK